MVDAAGTSRRSTGTDSSGHMAMLEIGEQAAALRRLLDRESDTGDARTTPRYPPSGPSVGVDEGCVAFPGAPTVPAAQSCMNPRASIPKLNHFSSAHGKY